MSKIKSTLKCVLATVAAVLPTALSAQLLQLTVPDTALQKSVYIVRLPANGEKVSYNQMVFDAKGRAIYDQPLRGQVYPVRIIFGNNGEASFYIEKGKKIKLTTTKKDGNLVHKYSGANADAATAFSAYRDAYKYTEFFERPDSLGRTKTTFDQKLTTLDAHHEEVIGICGKVKNAEMRESVLRDNECEYLRFRLAVMRMKYESEGRDYTKEDEYQQLLERIDLNDPHYESYNLITNYVMGKIPSDAKEKGLSNWGVEGIRIINGKISNPSLRQSLQAAIAQQVLTEGNDDLDPFVDVIKTTGDTLLINAVVNKAESIKKTQGGMAAPVFTFNDIDGNEHSSADFAGKLLYVDFWATWCGPCKAEIPHLKKLVEHFKDNDKVVFISVSIDTDVAAWKKMITADKPEWPQYIAVGEQAATISRDWGVNAIPRFIMINADGSICSSNAFRPSDPEAVQKIEQLIK